MALPKIHVLPSRKLFSRAGRSECVCKPLQTQAMHYLFNWKLCGKLFLIVVMKVALKYTSGECPEPKSISLASKALQGPWPLHWNNKSPFCDSRAISLAWLARLGGPWKFSSLCLINPWDHFPLHPSIVVPAQSISIHWDSWWLTCTPSGAIESRTSCASVVKEPNAWAKVGAVFSVTRMHCKGHSGSELDLFPWRVECVLPKSSSCSSSW